MRNRLFRWRKKNQGRRRNEIQVCVCVHVCMCCMPASQSFNKHAMWIHTVFILTPDMSVEQRKTFDDHFFRVIFIVNNVQYLMIFVFVYDSWFCDFLDWT